MSLDTFAKKQRPQLNYDFCKDLPFRVWHSQIHNNWSINNDEKKITLGWHGCDLELDKSSHPTELSALNYLKQIVIPKYKQLGEERNND